MIPNRELWDVAVRLIAQHGLEAPTIARGRALDAVQADRAPEFEVWEAVSTAVERLLKREPDLGESCH